MQPDMWKGLAVPGTSMLYLLVLGQKTTPVGETEFGRLIISYLDTVPDLMQRQHCSGQISVHADTFPCRCNKTRVQ